MFLLVILAIFIIGIVLYPFIALIEVIVMSIVRGIEEHSWTPVLVVLGIVVFLIIIPAVIKAGVL